MKKFVCSLVFILISLLATDRIGGMVMDYVGQHTNDVLGPKLRYLRDSIHEDVILMGASRCHHHYLPSILSDTLDMSVYNAGVGGSNNIYSHYIVLQHILARTTPKVICLEVMPADYCPQADDFSTVSFFAPLFGHSEAADSIYLLAGNHWAYQLSHLYRYNAKASSNILGLAFNRQKGEDHGYIPLPAPRQQPATPKKEETAIDRDSLKYVYMERFAHACQDRNIQLIFTVSPRFSTVDAHHYDVLKAFAHDHQIPFMDYHTSGLYLDHPEYFKDVSHLWDKGARRFSARFASDLKKLLQSAKAYNQ